MNLRISQLPLLAAPSTGAEFAVAQSGVTYKVTLAQLLAQINTIGGIDQVLTDGITIVGNGVSSPISVLNPLPTLGSNGQVLTVSGGAAIWQTPPSPLGLTTVTDGQTILGDGTFSDPIRANVGNLSLPGDNWGSQSALTSGLLVGNGLPISPIRIDVPALVADGQSIIAVGGNAVWGTPSAVVNTAGIITGNGILGNEIRISTLGAAQGEVLSFDGTNIVWASMGSNGGDNWGTQSVVTDSSLLGNGTSGALLSVANPLPTLGSDGQVLTVSGGAAIWQTPGGSGLPTGSIHRTLRHTAPNWVVSSLLANNDNELVINGNTFLGQSPFAVYSDQQQYAATFVPQQSVQTATGLYATAVFGNFNNFNVAGHFSAANQFGQAYALRIENGSEAGGRVLTCVDSLGHAEWQDLPTTSTYIASTGLVLNGNTFSHAFGASGHGGDVEQGNDMGLKVIRLRNIPINTTVPTVGQVLGFDGNEWKATTLPGATPYAAGVGLVLNGNTFSHAFGANGHGGDVEQGNDMGLKVIRLRNIPINTTVPTVGQVLEFDGNEWKATTLPGATPYAAGVGLVLNGNTFSHAFGANGHGGDVEQGNDMGLKVIRLRNIPINTTVPTVGQVLEFDGNEWKATTLRRNTIRCWCRFGIKRQ
ncbi:MAG: hypothetical protein IPL33_17865 [Sphingobacteriales bacterium]|nr:hypothetical protein [Sphingobacteriales bacterium]